MNWLLTCRIRIQTDWNLKEPESNTAVSDFIIRIQTDWNLKLSSSLACRLNMYIRIQTDWNLKYLKLDLKYTWLLYSNLDRLEFKAYKIGFIAFENCIRIQTDWNLKGVKCHLVKSSISIRIQTDWNLKIAMYIYFIKPFLIRIYTA